MERVKGLSDRERYRLIELLDPQITHYEFFLGRPPLARSNWSNDQILLAAIPQLSPCLNGWPNQTLFDYDYQLVKLSAEEFEFMQACQVNSDSLLSEPSKTQQTVKEILSQVQLDLEGVRSLRSRQLILLTPSQS
jgi:hypothetical protein